MPRPHTIALGIIMATSVNSMQIAIGRNIGNLIKEERRRLDLAVYLAGFAGIEESVCSIPALERVSGCRSMACFAMEVEREHLLRRGGVGFELTAHLGGTFARVVDSGEYEILLGSERVFCSCIRWRRETSQSREFERHHRLYCPLVSRAGRDDRCLRLFDAGTMVVRHKLTQFIVCVSGSPAGTATRVLVPILASGQHGGMRNAPQFANEQAGYFLLDSTSRRFAGCRDRAWDYPP